MNEEFLRNFRVKSQVRMSVNEKELFDKEVGYTEDMSRGDLIDLHNSIFEWYDIEMDEMDEDECEAMMATRELVLRHMRRDWLHIIK